MTLLCAEKQLVLAFGRSILWAHRMSKEKFFAHLKARFEPRLRAAGFEGSGQDFRRVRGEVVNAVNIQDNKHGGSCAVNLGIHLTFLPINSHGDLAAAATIEETNCEFRMRLANERDTDGWWKYGGLWSSSKSSADSLIETYFATGEPHFERFNSVPSIIAELDRERPDEKIPLGRVTRLKAALTAARIHAHLGNAEACRRAAMFALNRIGKAEALRTELEAFSQQA